MPTDDVWRDAFLRRRTTGVLWVTVPVAVVFALLCMTGWIQVLGYRVLGYSWWISLRAAQSGGDSPAEADWMFASAYIGLGPLMGALPARARPIVIFITGLFVVLVLNELLWQATA